MYGIILATALICGVAGLVTSTQASIIKTTKRNEGDYHAIFYNVPKTELTYIEDYDNVDKYYLSEELGYSVLEGSKNENKPYLSVMAGNERILE